jgi:hypothetical protein
MGNGAIDVSRHHAVSARVVAHAARLAETDEEVDVLHAALFLDDVLEQEVPRVTVRTPRVHAGAPARELADVLVVLTHPLAELVAVQPPGHPLLGKRIHAAVPCIDGVLEPSAERGRGHDAPPGAMIRVPRRQVKVW